MTEYRINTLPIIYSQIHLHDKHRNDVYFIEDAIGDNQITKAYPKIKDKYLNIGRLDNKISGYDGMIDDAGDIALNRRLTNDGNIKTDDLKSVLLHELQHGIQDREGFARGGNTEQFKKTQLDLEKEKWASIVNQTVNDGESIDSVLSQLKKEVLDRGIDDSTYSHDDFNAVLTLIQSKEPKSLIDKWIKDGQIKHDPYESYRSLAGEVEARTTQSRMDLNAQQRRENYPFDYKTYGYDVPAKSQIVDFGNNKANAQRPLTEFEQAHATAQRNAALPVEKGGLGLPADNTAMDRARAMGFDTDAYHGTGADIDAFDMSKVGSNIVLPVNAPRGVYTAKDADIASRYSNGNGSNVIPLIQKSSDTALNNSKIMATLDPSSIRSRFAAFDPFNRESSNLLAQSAKLAPTTALGAYMYNEKRKKSQGNQ